MTQDFETYLQQARTEFCLVAHKYNVRDHNELRTAIDSLLIAYDQAFLALRKHSVMQVPQFEKLLQVRLAELPYTKHLDDGQYNDGQAYGFECGARWAYEKLSSGTAVGKERGDASVSDGK